MEQLTDLLALRPAFPRYQLVWKRRKGNRRTRVKGSLKESTPDIGTVAVTKKKHPRNTFLDRAWWLGIRPQLLFPNLLHLPQLLSLSVPLEVGILFSK